MDDASRRAFAEELKELAIDFLQHLPNSMQKLRIHWDAVTSCDISEKHFSNLIRQAHSIAGTAGSFGFPDISAAAKELELKFQDVKATMPDLQQNECAVVQALLDTLDKAIRTAMEKGAVPIQVQTHKGQRHKRSRNIYLVEDDPHMARFLSLQLTHFGYGVECFESVEELRKKTNSELPASIVMDVNLPEGERAGIDFFSGEMENTFYKIPKIFISRKGDFLSRLLAVRAGGIAYFTKPIDISQLVDLLDLKTSHVPDEPFRVLIMEDDHYAAEHISLVLEEEGIQAKSLFEPHLIESILDEFRPDLILMDLYLNECSGLELTVIIRQQPKYMGIPIVFLSQERNPDKQLLTLEHGSDDFLTKPVPRERLVTTVISRARRARSLRDLMKRDSLTGLLNHNSFKEALDVEITRNVRNHSTLSLAMIDLDHFKEVNDRHGHPAGDHVLQSISRMLQQRLRRTDIIGRYGGEEFAILLPDTSREKAFTLLNTIREDWGATSHQAGGEDFRVTFSAGISTSPPFHDAAWMINAADTALYEAKQRGRNQVRWAERTRSKNQ